MVNKLSCLKKNQDIQRVLKTGFIFKKQGVTVRYITNNKEVLRLAFILPKKKIKKAVSRNKIKRWVKEYLRKYLNHSDCYLDILISVENEFNEYNIFKKILDECFKKQAS